MLNILLKSASFVFLIVLGYLLKRCRFFGPKDYTIPMKLVLNITLPAASCAAGTVPGHPGQCG